VDLDLDVRAGITGNVSFDWTGSVTASRDLCVQPPSGCIEVGMDGNLAANVEAGLSLASCLARSDADQEDRLGSAHEIADPDNDASHPVPDYCLTVLGRDYCFGNLLGDLCGNITIVPAGLRTGGGGHLGWRFDWAPAECADEGLDVSGHFDGVVVYARLNLLITEFNWEFELLPPASFRE